MHLMQSVSQMTVLQLAGILHTRLAGDRSLLVYLDDVSGHYSEVHSVQVSFAGLLTNLFSGSQAVVTLVLSHYPLERLGRLISNASLDVRHNAY